MVQPLLDARCDPENAEWKDLQHWEDLQTLMQFVYAENTFPLAGIPQRNCALYVATRKMPKKNKPGRKLISVKNVTCLSAKSVLKCFIQRVYLQYVYAHYIVQHILYDRLPFSL